MALARALSALTSEQLLALLVCTLADGHDDSLSSISSPHALAYASCGPLPGCYHLVHAGLQPQRGLGGR